MTENNPIPNPEAERPKKRKLMLQTKDYRGKNPKLIREHRTRLEITRKVEEFLNNNMTDKAQTLTVGDVARETSLDEEDVRIVLNYNGHGHNGITF